MTSVGFLFKSKWYNFEKNNRKKKKQFNGNINYATSKFIFNSISYLIVRWLFRKKNSEIKGDFNEQA